MDQNKNWIDYRYYNPNYEVTHDLNVIFKGTTNFTMSKRGLYCLTNTAFINSSYVANAITTNGQIKNRFDDFPVSTYTYVELIVYSDGTKTASFTCAPGNGTDYGGCFTAIYIGPYSNVTASGRLMLEEQNNYSQTFTTQNQFVHFILSGSIRYSRNFTTQNIENKYVTVWDSGSLNRYSAAAINRGGKITCTGGCSSNPNDVGIYGITYYTLVE